MKTRKNESKKWTAVVKMERYTVYHHKKKATMWQVRLGGSGNYLRRQFVAANLEQAVALAPRIAGLTPQPLPKIKRRKAKGLATASVPKAKGLSLESAFMAMLNASKQKPASRKITMGNIARFMEFIAIKFPEVSHWNQLARHHVRAYMDGLQGEDREVYLARLKDDEKPKGHFLGLRDKAPNTIRLALNPIRMTVRYMAREHDITPFDCGGFGEGAKPQADPPSVYLPQVVRFCEHLKEQKNTILLAGVVLQGICGMRETEVLRLHWNSVDLSEGFLRIQGEVKTQESERCIPLPAYVVECLHLVRKAHPRTKWIVPTSIGDPYDCSKGYREYGRMVNGMIRRWDKKVRWKCYQLRKAFPQWTRRNKIDKDLAEMYIGHKVQGIDRHYVRNITDATDEGVAELHENLAHVRAEIIQPLDLAIGEILRGSNGVTEIVEDPKICNEICNVANSKGAVETAPLGIQP